MRTIGATLFLVGLAQWLFQLHLLSSTGYWPAFTLGDLLDRAWLAGVEINLLMLALGLVLMLAGPLGRLVLQRHGRRLQREAHHPISPTPAH